jgi:uncharacterized protein YjfI (DUF2170 family)
MRHFGTQFIRISGDANKVMLMNLILPSQQSNDAINFNAFVPVGRSDLGGDSTYQINAATVAQIPITF